MKQNYYKHKLKNLINVSKVITIHYFEFNKYFKSQGEKHDFWELVYAENESIICSANGEHFTLNEGEVIFHKPNEFHALSANGISAPNVIIISFDCKSEAIHYFSNKIVKLTKESARYLYDIVALGKMTFDIKNSNPDLKKMNVLPNATLGGEQMIKNMLELFLINVIRDETETPSGNDIFVIKSENSSNVTSKIIKYLTENVKNDVSIDDLCKSLNYNKSYLFRQFKESTGTTIMKYHLTLKIELAKKILRESNKSVSEIAEELSFYSPNYFSKTFKKYTGYTPLKYKKSRR